MKLDMKNSLFVGGVLLIIASLFFAITGESNIVTDTNMHAAIVSLGFSIAAGLCFIASAIIERGELK